MKLKADVKTVLRKVPLRIYFSLKILNSVTSTLVKLTDPSYECECENAGSLSLAFRKTVENRQMGLFHSRHLNLELKVLLKEPVFEIWRPLSVRLQTCSNGIQ